MGGVISAASSHWWAQQTISLKTVEGQRSLRCGDKCLENIPFKLIFLQTNIKILS